MYNKELHLRITIHPDVFKEDDGWEERKKEFVMLFGVDAWEDGKEFMDEPKKEKEFHFFGIDVTSSGAYNKMAEEKSKEQKKSLLKLVTMGLNRLEGGLPLPSKEFGVQEVTQITSTTGWDEDGCWMTSSSSSLFM